LIEKEILVKMNRAIIFIVGVLFLCGCMTMNTGIGGKEIDPQLISKIELNQTTKTDILQWFGNPHSISTTAAGQEVYKFVFMQTKSKMTPIPLFTKVSVDTKYQELNVTFKDNIVVDYSSTRR
jgi:outer membrane protein assembly factor BamE (lipoprotein component of BamABCDE complex)